MGLDARRPIADEFARRKLPGDRERGASDLATVRREARPRLYESASLGYRMLSINDTDGDGAKSPLGASAKLRAAFRLSFDRSIINQVAFDGTIIPSNQPEASGSTYSTAAFPLPARDLARAKALVGEHGEAGG
jgi:peptide/nickel transport system substrate-binding protein